MEFTSDEHAFAFYAAADAEATAALEAYMVEGETEVMAEDFFVSSAGQ